MRICVCVNILLCVRPTDVAENFIKHSQYCELDWVMRLIRIQGIRYRFRVLSGIARDELDAGIGCVGVVALSLAEFLWHN